MLSWYLLLFFVKFLHPALLFFFFFFKSVTYLFFSPLFSPYLTWFSFPFFHSWLYLFFPPLKKGFNVLGYIHTLYFSFLILILKSRWAEFVYSVSKETVKAIHSVWEFSCGPWMLIKTIKRGLQLIPWGVTFIIAHFISICCPTRFPIGYVIWSFLPPLEVHKLHVRSGPEHFTVLLWLKCEKPTK